MILIVLVINTLKRVGEGIPCIFLGYFNDSIFFTKQDISNNQVEGERIKQASEWDDHTIVTWVNEGAYVIYFLG
jgi:hypothetical protein